MSAVVAAARALHRIASRWRRHAQLPGYPVERGNLAALGAIYRLERALNPDRLASDHDSRPGRAPRGWPDDVADGLTWADNLVRILMDRHGIGSMDRAAGFREWADAMPRLPDTIAIRDDELQSLREAIRLLPGPGALPEPRPADDALGPARQADPGPAPAVDTGAPVALFGVRGRPFVLGRPKDHLSPTQYRVIEALLHSGDDGLSKVDLERNSASGDAVGVLKRLAKSDGDWSSVISLPGRPGGFGYRLVMPDESGQPAEDRRHPQTAASPAHTSAQKADSPG